MIWYCFYRSVVAAEPKFSEGFSSLSLQPVNLVWFYFKVPHVALTWIQTAFSFCRREFVRPLTGKEP